MQAGAGHTSRFVRVAAWAPGGPARLLRGHRATAPTRPDPAREKVGHRRGLMDPWGKRGPGPPGPATDPLLIISNRLMGGGDGGDYG